jgi:hypothetical protein
MPVSTAQRCLWTLKRTVRQHTVKKDPLWLEALTRSPCNAHSQQVRTASLLQGSVKCALRVLLVRPQLSCMCKDKMLNSGDHAGICALHLAKIVP